jgi:hypothetical protein
MSAEGIRALLENAELRKLRTVGRRLFNDYRSYLAEGTTSDDIEKSADAANKLSAFGERDKLVNDLVKFLKPEAELPEGHLATLKGLLGEKKGAGSGLEERGDEARARMEDVKEDVKEVEVTCTDLVEDEAQCQGATLVDVSGGLQWRQCASSRPGESIQVKVGEKEGVFKICRRHWDPMPYDWVFKKPDIPKTAMKNPLATRDLAVKKSKIDMRTYDDLVGKLDKAILRLSDVELQIALSAREAVLSIDAEDISLEAKFEKLRRALDKIERFNKAEHAPFKVSEVFTGKRRRAGL